MARRFEAFFGFALAVMAGRTAVALMDTSLSVLLEDVGKCASDKEMMELVNMKVSKLNRTAFEVRGNFIIKQDFNNNASITVVMYAWKNRRWGTAPVFQKTHNFCKFIKEDKDLWPKINAFLKLPNECPLAKGNYAIQNAYVQMNGIPPIYPQGCYRMEFKISEGRYSLACMFVIANINGASGSPTRQCI